MIDGDSLKIENEYIETNAFSNIISGDLDLSNVDLTLSLNNFVGAEAKVIFNNLSSENTITNQTRLAGIDLNTGFNVINSPYILNTATLSNGWLPIEPFNTTISLEASELLEIFPNRINTSADIYLNHNISPTLDGFLFTDFTFDVSLDMTIPLTFIANKIILRDTTDFNYNEDSSYEIEKLYLNIKNGYPLDANIKLILLDYNNNILDTLFKNSNISSGLINDHYIVYEPSITILESEKIDFNNINKIIFYTELSSADINDFVSIYSSYNIEFILSAKLKLTIGE